MSGSFFISRYDKMGPLFAGDSIIKAQRRNSADLFIGIVKSVVLRRRDEAIEYLKRKKFPAKLRIISNEFGDIHAVVPRISS
jgi:hypothetical protein